MADFTDNFDRDYNQPIGNGWTDGPSAAFYISNTSPDGTAYDLSGGSGRWCYRDAGVANVEVQVIAQTRGTGGIWIRGGGSNDGIACRWDGTTFTFYKWESGSYTGNIAQQTGLTIADGDTIKVTTVGTALEMFQNGVSRLTATSSLHLGNTRVGLYSEGGATRFDDFEYTAVASFAIDRAKVLTGSSGTVTLSLTGSGTSWTGTPFSISGSPPTGWSIASQNVTNGTSATVTLNRGTGTGTITISDGATTDTVDATSTATTVATGNSSAGATWDTLEAPGSAHDAVVAAGHALTVNANLTIDDLTVADTGSVTVAAGVTLTLDTASVGNAVFQLGEAGGGANLVFGATFTVGGNGLTNARFRTRGSGGSISSTASGTIAVTDGLFDFQGTGTIEDLGDGTDDSLTIAITSATSGTHTLSGWTLDNCGRVRVANSLPGGMGLVLSDWFFTNSAHATESFRTSGSTAGAGTKTINGCSFDKAATIGKAFVVGATGSNMFGSGLSYDGTGEAGDVSNSVLWADDVDTGAHPMQGNFDDCYFYAGGADNPHFPIPNDVGVAKAGTGCIVEYGGDFSIDSGNAFYGEGDWTFENCIVLPAGKHPDTASGAITPIAGSDYKVIHCTLHSPDYNGGLLLGDGGAATGDIEEAKSNLFWARLADADGKAAHAIDTTTDNILTPGSCTHNGLVNMANPAYEGDYPTTQPGANDVRLDSTNEATVFVAPTRNLASWAVTRGSASGTYAGKVADAKGYLLADPSLLADLLSHIRGGFTPIHESLRDAGHDGVTIGAVEMAEITGSPWHYYQQMMAG